VLLLGELHGTREMPQLFTELVCRATTSGLDVIVGLELQPELGAAAERYASSAHGDLAERVRIIQPRLKYGDGSSSVAVVDAFEALRKLARTTARVHVFGFRTEVKDARYAAAIEAMHHEHPRAVMLAFMGNGHIGLTQAPEDDEPPVGMLLRAHGLDVRSIYIDWTDGTAYFLGPHGPGIYVQDRAPRKPGQPFVIERSGLPEYDLAISVGRIHASLPVKLPR
jgi:hypothetical protein